MSVQLKELLLDLQLANTWGLLWELLLWGPELEQLLEVLSEQATEKTMAQVKAKRSVTVMVLHWAKVLVKRWALVKVLELGSLSVQELVQQWGMVLGSR